MMAIVSSCLPLPNFTPPCPTITNAATGMTKKMSLRSTTCSRFLGGGNKKRNFRLPVVVASTCWPQIDVDYLRREFPTSGVTFTGIGNSCVVRMELENGTAASFMLPSGLITSFRAQMWHGATMELLHTSVVSQGENNAPVIQGGLSLALGFEVNNDLGLVSWFPNAWTLSRVNGTPQESVQVELVCRTSEGSGNVELKHIINLQRDLLTSEIQVSNTSASSLRIMGSATCHLAVSTPDATYAVGLEGSDYFIRPPFVANFSIIPPGFERTPEKFWAFNKLFPRNRDDAQSLVRDIKEELEGEEEDNYKHLTEKLSRIYTSTPRSLTFIDRGRRNSVAVRRNGFKEVYIFSPGSEHEFYNKYSYICIGHAALLEPVILDGQSEWRGGLQLWNPNT